MQRLVLTGLSIFPVYVCVGPTMCRIGSSAVGRAGPLA